MIIYKTLSQWTADMTFKNMAEYDAYRAWELAKGKIGGIESDLKNEAKNLTRKSMAEYVEETKEIIAGLELKLIEWKAKKVEAEQAMDFALTQPEEFAKI